MKAQDICALLGPFPKRRFKSITLLESVGPGQPNLQPKHPSTLSFFLLILVFIFPAEDVSGSYQFPAPALPDTAVGPYTAPFQVFVVH